VSTSAGGVIIPYLGTIDLTGVRPGKGATFGYSDCLKWGYDGTIKVAAFNATQAVGILGLDATQVGTSIHVWWHAHHFYKQDRDCSGSTYKRTRA
jgi:hypothetical protein